MHIVGRAFSHSISHGERAIDQQRIEFRRRILSCVLESCQLITDLSGAGETRRGLRRAGRHKCRVR